MLQYEHGRTSDIVRRLMGLMRLVRTVIVILAVVGVAAMGALVGKAAGLGYFGGGLLGVILGFVLGVFIASLATIGMEWMTQLLVAQGELVAALQADRDAPGPGM